MEEGSTVNAMCEPWAMVDATNDAQTRSALVKYIARVYGWRGEEEGGRGIC